MYDRAYFKKKTRKQMCFHFLWNWLFHKVNVTKNLKIKGGREQKERK